MDVEVDELGTGLRVAELKAGLLDRLPQGCRLRLLAWVQVTSRLQPDAKPSMAVEDDPPDAGDDGRCGDMRRVGLLVERLPESPEGAQERSLRRHLAGVGRPPANDGGENQVSPPVSLRQTASASMRLASR